MGEPRITPVGEPWSESLLRWMPPGVQADPLLLFRVLARREDLADRMRPLGAGLLGRGRLPVRVRELVILRVCALAGARYEWGVHVAAFPELAEQEVRRTALGGEWPDERDALIVRACEEIHAEGHPTSPTSAALIAALGEEIALELVVLAGWYRLLAGVIGLAGLESEAWGRGWPD